MPEHIDFRREDDGRWRWLYVNPEADVELRSSKTYPSASQARSAAGELYPGVAMAEVAESPGGKDELTRGKLLRQAAVSFGLLALLFKALKGAGANGGSGSGPPQVRRGQHRGLNLSGRPPPEL